MVEECSPLFPFAPHSVCVPLSSVALKFLQSPDLTSFNKHQRSVSCLHEFCGTLSMTFDISQFPGEPEQFHNSQCQCKHKRNCDKESEHRINQTATEHTAELADNQSSAKQNKNNNPLFCRYSPKSGNDQGAIINRLVCHICIFQKFSLQSLTVACARSRFHHRSQTSDSRNIRCTFWPEIRHFRQSGQLL